MPSSVTNVGLPGIGTALVSRSFMILPPQSLCFFRLPHCQVQRERDFAAELDRTDLLAISIDGLVLVLGFDPGRLAVRLGANLLASQRIASSFTR
jgi:hypothetical protein